MKKRKPPVRLPLNMCSVENVSFLFVGKSFTAQKSLHSDSAYIADSRINIFRKQIPLFADDMLQELDYLITLILVCLILFVILLDTS